MENAAHSRYSRACTRAEVVIALISATISSADLIGITDITGTVEANKDADIVAYNGNPLDDISVLLQPVFVMARGNEVNLDVPPIDMFPWPEL